jgi:hypothetical protein
VPVAGLKVCMLELRNACEESYQKMPTSRLPEPPGVIRSHAE